MVTFIACAILASPNAAADFAELLFLLLENLVHENDPEIILSVRGMRFLCNQLWSLLIQERKGNGN